MEYNRRRAEAWSMLMTKHTGALAVAGVLMALVAGCNARRDDQPSATPAPTAAATQTPASTNPVATPQPWPSFRGINASGVADGQAPPATWDVEKGVNVRWKTPIPGLGHSCPIVWGDRVFLTTAISGDPNAGLRVGHYGNIDSVPDPTVHSWRIYCLDKNSGKILWEHTAHEGVPRVKRHLKGTHANPTPVTDGTRVVAGFGSEGIYGCYDFQGNPLWKVELGALDSGYHSAAAYQWGFGSSPIIYRNLVIIQCDVAKNSFLAAYDLANGQEVWRVPRDEIPSWGTPTIVESPRGAELVTNGSAFIRGYDPLTGKELWRLAQGAEITVPTPVVGKGLIFVTSGKGPQHPIYAFRAGSRGDISLKDGQSFNDAVAWSQQKEGSYLPTPIVYGDYLYTCDTRTNIIGCHEATTGKSVYRGRLAATGTITASPVAADGKLYFASEESGVFVVKAGPDFEVLGVNPLGDVCLATPAISDGMFFIRTQRYLIGIGTVKQGTLSE
jgi:outer membrane protein assembly factor BamB